MELTEFFIWSAMIGALLMVLMASILSWLSTRSTDAAKNILFVSVTGFTVALMSGLPEYILRIPNPHTLLPLKVAAGPWASALGLVLLGNWLGIVREDMLVRRSVVWGSIGAVASGIALSVWAWMAPGTPPQEILVVSGLVYAVIVVLGVMIALRGASMGDSLAMRMCVACGFMAVMVAGLYAKTLHYQTGLWFWVMTASATLVYYLMVMGLTTERNREYQKLRKLAQGSFSTDPVTGLPTGAALVSKVDDAIWRAVRLNRNSVVMAVWVSNLYALHETAGREVDQEIQTILTARVRRAVGFRNVVGLYHPRCYMVAITAANSPDRIRKAAEKAYQSLVSIMVVGSIVGRPHKYRPELGMAVVTLSQGGAEASLAMNQAERLAQNAASSDVKLMFAELSADPIEVDTSFDQIG